MQSTTKIRKIRELKGYSQQYIAEKLGITQAAYSKIESNENSINFDKLKTIANVLEIDPFDLLNFNDQQIFNNCNNNGIWGNNGSYYAYSKKEQELYESKIKHLKEEVKFLRDMLNKQNAS